jgi:heat shock protein HslJ
MKKILIIVLVLVIGFVGWSFLIKNKNVAESPTTTVINTPNIGSIEYRLSSFNGKEIPIDQDYILTVTPTNLSIKFCNNMSGNYTVNDSSMIQGTVTSTLMFCDEPENIMTMESSFGTLINEGASLALDGESTTIYSKDNTVRFSFKPIAQ